MLSGTGCLASRSVSWTCVRRGSPTRCPCHRAGNRHARLRVRHRRRCEWRAVHASAPTRWGPRWRAGPAVRSLLATTDSSLYRWPANRLFGLEEAIVRRMPKPIRNRLRGDRRRWWSRSGLGPFPSYRWSGDRIGPGVLWRRRAGDNASSARSKTPARYIEDAPNRTRDTLSVTVAGLLRRTEVQGRCGRRSSTAAPTPHPITAATAATRPGPA